MTPELPKAELLPVKLSYGYDEGRGDKATVVIGVILSDGTARVVSMIEGEDATLFWEAYRKSTYPAESAAPDGLRSAIVAEIQKRRQSISKNDGQDKWGRGWEACAIGFCDELEKLLAAPSLVAQGER